ncbi:MAG TPA: tRNA (adenosine(37)-N6)-threonylcarbamoyltransferase complex transferase subunit TsaD, partial [Thermodesulfobacteriota bacterium]|nr:tRNA (adenosine(37)-N6)-threonylcarbamoyltransferase complex transferase subunit TsaD [Thermodesulfobacteriota bacterium]
MLILGIESSCDDMAAAVVRDGRYILSSVVSSQDAIHKKYGGIVPELASRRHIETVIPVVEEALNQARVTLDEIDAIGVTQGPGLVGSILVGLSFAKSVAYVQDIPFVGVNHIEAHPMAVFLEKEVRSQKSEVTNLQPSTFNLQPRFPFIALVASGGHTTLFKFKDFGDYEILGKTRDDAAGEAFDKVAKLLGLGYPGGAVIDKLAKTGNVSAIEFTRPYISKDTFDFSFSGIKTAVLNYIKELGKLNPEGLSYKVTQGFSLENSGMINDLSASFQEAVVDVLTDKAVFACKANKINNLVVSGGVACNSRLRQKLHSKSKDHGIQLFIPEPSLCSDN